MIHSIHCPGPPRLPPGQAPGGVVFRIYNRAGTVLVERVLRPGDDTAESAGADVIATLEALPAEGESSICLVCYDGDTGLRWTPEDWEEIGMEPD